MMRKCFWIVLGVFALALDGTVFIYSPTFFTVRSNRQRQAQIFRSVEELEAYLSTL